MPSEEKEFAKSRLNDSAFTLFWSYNYNSEINLTKNDRLTLNNLSNNKNIIIQKSEKGNSVVLFDKDKYLEGMSKILTNNANFEMLQFDYVLQKKNINALKDLNNKEEITHVDYIHLYPCSSCPGMLYGLARVNKPVTDRFSSRRPILSAVHKPSHKLINTVINTFNINRLCYKGFVLISGRSVFC